MSGRLPSLKPDKYTDGEHIVPVPFHRRDLKPGTLRSIVRLAGWSLDEFLEKL